MLDDLAYDVRSRALAWPELIEHESGLHCGESLNLFGRRRSELVGGGHIESFDVFTETQCS
jgi:hypothetical protein